MTDTDLPTAPPSPHAPPHAAGTPAQPPARAPSDGGAWTVLCVDDEPGILSALKRVLRSEDCKVLQANGGAEALQLLEQQPVDVVVSDMRMPGMDGAALLAQVRKRWPETARILLTGYADMNATIAAINDGQIYRYIHKPWDETELRLTVRQAAEHQMLQRDRDRLQALTASQNEELRVLNTGLEERVQARTAELQQANDLLRRNYLTSIKIFSSMLELRSGVLAGHGKRAAGVSRKVANAMDLTSEETQDVFVAGLLHDIGFMALPDAILSKPVGKLTAEEMALYQRHPVLGAQSFMALDDHQSVAALIRGHHERFDGTGFPDNLQGTQIPMGARILAIASTYDDLTHGHLTGKPLTDAEARTILQRGRGTQFDPEVLDVFLHVTQEVKPKPARIESFTPENLQPGMALAKDLLSKEGVLLLSAGHALSAEMISRIRKYEKAEGLSLLLDIRMPD
ncbi:MAG: response regulator [Acidovorax sp.]|uniref:HD domain-containing phosphohydrolase n=1 Tax=Acidovorax sp. TaxID=1872122 RepID=UPI0025C6F121|nr:HD domain-containing phosphohydrolase [Acidovorax sp.]MDH4427216.1 response regulator [Acidovorax sp.]MDH4446110.1 response regulator [Acidovorax sp.]MDH4464722.1 response regulator [Acidovorax sp.]